MKSVTNGQKNQARWVVCLCAQWCGTCRDYRAVFAQVASENPNSQFVWVDVEDQADLIGDLDIETFPLLLIVNASAEVVFFAPITPQAAALQRVVHAAQNGQLPAQMADENLQTLLQVLPRLF